MNYDNLPDNPYLLLTPGPLSTSKTVKAAMLRDWCTWDADYNENIVQDIRHRLVKLATANTEDYSAVLMQGSGTFSVESVLSSAVPANGKLLIIANGAYGMRMATISKMARIPHEVYQVGEDEWPDLGKIHCMLDEIWDISHVAVVHCETTTGILNPVREITALAKKFEKITIVDAMSSFGGIPMDIAEWQIDFLISSANKCIQGIPGFGFVIAKTEELEACREQARSHSLDLYNQWATMEKGKGKWRFTSPTHVVRAFQQALFELEKEGGIEQRHNRYRTNQQSLVSGMRAIGFETVLSDALQSPIITAFHSPVSPSYKFNAFYEALKNKGFVIYPGKITKGDSFRIGNIGEVYPEDMQKLVTAIREIKFW